jgi:hypothetical protein
VTGWEAGAAARMTVRSPSGTGTTSSVGVTGDGEWTAVWKPATAATGYHTIFITVEDEAGNSESDSGTVFVDSDGPVIQIVTSVPSNTRQAPEEIIGRAWDESGVTSMELTWAGPDLQESARFAPDSTWDEADTLYWRFDTPDSVNGGADYVEGGYILKAFAGDQFGNEKSRQVSFKLDRTAPAPPVISAVPARMIQPQLDLYIEFQTGTDTLFVYRNAGGTTWATKFITAGHEPGDPFEVTLEAGQNEFQAEAKDKAGNISALSNTVSTVLDPATGINYPEVFRGPGVFQVVSERTAWSVTVEIFDMRGDRIRKLTATGPGTSFDIGWDLTTDDGEEVNNGPCLVMITINSEGGRTVDKAFIAVVR